MADTMGASSAPVGQMQISYMETVQRKRLYSGLTLLIFSIFMVDDGCDARDPRDRSGIGFDLYSGRWPNAGNDYDCDPYRGRDGKTVF